MSFWAHLRVFLGLLVSFGPFKCILRPYKCLSGLSSVSTVFIGFPSVSSILVGLHSSIYEVQSILIAWHTDLCKILVQSQNDSQEEKKSWYRKDYLINCVDFDKFDFVYKFIIRKEFARN